MPLSATGDRIEKRQPYYHPKLKHLAFGVLKRSVSVPHCVCPVCKTRDFSHLKTDYIRKCIGGLNRLISRGRTIPGGWLMATYSKAQSLCARDDSSCSPQHGHRWSKRARIVRSDLPRDYPIMAGIQPFSHQHSPVVRTSTTSPSTLNSRHLTTSRSSALTFECRCGEGEGGSPNSLISWVRRESSKVLQIEFY